MNVRISWFAAGVGAMALVLWVWDGGVGLVLPLLVLLACPLMMLVMMRGMGSMHDRPPGTHVSQSPSTARRSRQRDDESQ